ncbi:MAG TPA: hypothetical protein VKM72_21190 [Thermoanaerobaculia bacterium]|nr:hypothetical protein [Thermoanaerobaculia bacterium]
MVRSAQTPVRRSSLRFIAVPFLVYLLHAWLFGGWIVDDAGISFSYARNLAAGHGLVAQPGLPPVEGYSNFLWVLLMAQFFPLRLFDPVLTPKLVGVALTGGFFLGLAGALRKLDPAAGGAVAVVALCLTALNTSFTVWTISGLENSLYVAWIGVLFGLLVRERTGGPRPWISAAAGAAAAGIALTRPDGLLYAALYPLLTLGAEEGAPRIGPAAGRIARFAAVFLVLFGGFLAFRVTYFGDLQPNTYYAKSAPMGALMSQLVTLQPSIWHRLRDPLESAADEAGTLLLVPLAGAVAFLAWRRRLRWGHAALLAFAGCAALVYILLPGDWMREYRFATPFYPFFYAGVCLLTVTLGCELIRRSGVRKLVGGGAAALALGLALLLFLPRSRTYAAGPALAFSEVERKIGRRFNRYADALDVREGSFLVPDIGGALWSSRLRIYDLAGLTDRTLARTLQKDRGAFQEYVFEETRPTFILVHGPWAVAAGLNRDPRFRRDYVPLYLQGDPGGEITVGPGRQAGIFVRKDVVAGKDAAVEAIRAELAAGGY